MTAAIVVQFDRPPVVVDFGQRAVVAFGIPGPAGGGGGGGGTAEWGDIDGDIADQDDLQAALDGKLAATHAGTGGSAHANAVASGAAGFMTGADKAKLDGVATGATANASDAQLRDRSTHTGTQAIATVTGLQAALDGKEEAGAAAAAVAAHEAAPDPHSQYLTAAEGAAAYDALGAAAAVSAALATHTGDTANPHAVTKAQVGLANVDNTSDADKPVSTAQQAALDSKQPVDATLTAFAGLTIAANTIIFGTGADAFAVTSFAANTFPARSSSGNLAAKTITDFALTLLDDADAATMRTTLGITSGLTYFAESQSTASPNGTVHVSTLTASGASTNVDFVTLPKGNGALIAQVPDGTTTSGNKRGAYAVDWQRERNAAVKVASGSYSVIGGGIYNTASGANSCVPGGYDNTASGQESFAANRGNFASGPYAAAFGISNNVSGAGGFAAVSTNTVSGSWAAAIGSICLADGEHSFMHGVQSSARGLQAATGRSAGAFASGGDAQWLGLVVRRATTDATASGLSTAGAAPAAATTMVLPNSSAYLVVAHVVCREHATGDCKAWEMKALVRRGANAASTAIVGSVTATVIAEDAGATTWTATLVANTTLGSIDVQFTGEAAHNIKTVARFDSVQVVG